MCIRDRRGLYDTGHLSSVSQGSGYADLDSGLQTDDFILISQDGFVQVLEELAFAFASRTLLGQVIDTKEMCIRDSLYSYRGI